MITWKENYNIHRADFKTITIVCGWTSEGYKISVNRVSLKNCQRDISVAKQKGIALAKKLLAEDLALLNQE